MLSISDLLDEDKAETVIFVIVSLVSAIITTGSIIGCLTSIIAAGRRRTITTRKMHCRTYKR